MYLHDRVFAVCAVKVNTLLGNVVRVFTNTLTGLSVVFPEPDGPVIVIFFTVYTYNMLPGMVEVRLRLCISAREAFINVDFCSLLFVS